MRKTNERSKIQRTEETFSIFEDYLKGYTLGFIPIKVSNPFTIQESKFVKDVSNLLHDYDIVPVNGAWVNSEVNKFYTASGIIIEGIEYDDLYKICLDLNVTNYVFCDATSFSVFEGDTLWFSGKAFDVTINRTIDYILNKLD